MSQSTVTTAPYVEPIGRGRTQARAASASGFFGSALEYYDFVIFGVAAALVFGDVFFADAKSSATLMSMATFGVAYVARPVGAIMWGHLGDRMGRASVLQIILLVMGVATFLVGCIPSYATIGMAAPTLLIVLRVIQGISAGGESSGSATLSMEHAPDNRRAYYSSFTLVGSNFGNLLASLAFLPVAAMPKAQLLSWGWRIPFWASAVVVLITWFIRRRVKEPEAFEAAAAKGRAKVPLGEVMRFSWKPFARVTFGSLMIVVSSIVTVWSLSFATKEQGLSRSSMLLLTIVVSLGAIITLPVWGRLSDRVGRKPVFMTAAIGSAICLPLYLYALTTHSWTMIYLSAVLLMCVFFAMYQAIITSTFLEMFPARIRYTGMGVANMLGILVAGFMPMIAQAFVGNDKGNWVPVAAVSVACILVSGIAVATGPENFRVPTARLGLAPDEPSDRIADAGLPTGLDEHDAAELGLMDSAGSTRAAGARSDTPADEVLS